MGSLDEKRKSYRCPFGTVWLIGAAGLATQRDFGERPFGITAMGIAAAVLLPAPSLVATWRSLWGSGGAADRLLELLGMPDADLL